jgi:long-chain acyl-CoA synthetase
MATLRFRLHPASRLLAPSAPFAAARDCVARGETLRAGPEGLTGAAPGADGPWLFCATSGSSGAPKVIRRRPASWIASFDLAPTLFGTGPGDICAVLGHPGHSLALYAALEAFHLGADLLPLAGLRPPEQARRLHEARASLLYATPTQLRLLAGVPGAALPHLRQVLCGGGKLDAALRGALARLCRAAQLREFYGASETSFIALSDDDTPPAAVGRPYPGVELRLQDGEIFLRSPYLFDGYAAGEAGDTRWQGGFLTVGEMGFLDPKGQLHLLGRRSRMFTVADHNVFPEAIEAVVMALPGVRACAVVPRPDALRGNAPLCFVEGDLPEAELRAACRAALAPQAVPRAFRRLDKLPLLPAGKPDLAALQALADAPA